LARRLAQGGGGALSQTITIRPGLQSFSAKAPVFGQVHVGRDDWPPFSGGGGNQATTQAVWSSAGFIAIPTARCFQASRKSRRWADRRKSMRHASHVQASFAAGKSASAEGKRETRIVVERFGTDLLPESNQCRHGDLGTPGDIQPQPGALAPTFGRSGIHPASPMAQLKNPPCPAGHSDHRGPLWAQKTQPNQTMAGGPNLPSQSAAAIGDATKRYTARWIGAKLAISSSDVEGLGAQAGCTEVSWTTARKPVVSELPAIRALSTIVPQTTRRFCCADRYYGARGPSVAANCGNPEIGWTLVQAQDARRKDLRWMCCSFSFASSMHVKHIIPALALLNRQEGWHPGGRPTL